MYRGFRLDSDIEINESLVHHSSEKNTPDITAVENIIMSGKPIDAAEIADCLFPKGRPDVFLSHSFQDRSVALKLAEAMRAAGLNVFIDSKVWGSVYDLLKKVDDTYCKHANSEIYDYNKRNYSTAHVYMILNTALHKMIDRAEAFLFIGTENSLVASAKGMTSEQDEQKTCSPWIHSELMISSMIRRNLPERFVQKSSIVTEAYDSAIDSARQLEVHHPAPLAHLELIDQEVMNKWLWLCLNGDKDQHSLDVLYQYIK
jgi:hypothetical protein